MSSSTWIILRLFLCITVFMLEDVEPSAMLFCIKRRQLSRYKNLKGKPYLKHPLNYEIS
ncbi:hypothetical protein Hanom_Chr14g01310441 [Helianthus anomalus]